MRFDEMVIKGSELDTTNTETRLSVVLLLDTSGSMDGKPINELNEGVKYFFEAIKKDEMANYAADISIVSFNTNVKVEFPFSPIDEQYPPRLQASGLISMGQAVELALEMVEKRQNDYKDLGISFYKPWIVLMSDGEPTDGIENAVRKVQKLGDRKKLVFYPVAIGDSANKDVLRRFSTLGNSVVLKIKSADYFKDFFEWLSASISIASTSIPGDEKMKTPELPRSIEIDL